MRARTGKPRARSDGQASKQSGKHVRNKSTTHWLAPAAQALATD